MKSWLLAMKAKRSSTMAEKESDMAVKAMAGEAGLFLLSTVVVVLMLDMRASPTMEV